MHILAITPGDGFQAARWERILGSGIDALMIREKALEARELLRLARWVRERAPDLALWVNGRLEVALAAGCGLHAPEAYPEVAPGLVPLSRPLHDPDAFPGRAGAQQLLLSPVYATPGKGPALGAEGLHRWLDRLPAFQGRFLALGGITAGTAAALRHPRLAGVALIRELWQAEEPWAVVDRLRESWE